MAPAIPLMLDLTVAVASLWYVLGALADGKRRAGWRTLAHAAVATLPRVAAEAIREFARHGSTDGQEAGAVWSRVLEARQAAATLLGCQPDEIALLGPTTLGLNLVAIIIRARIRRKKRW